MLRLLPVWVWLAGYWMPVWGQGIQADSIRTTDLDELVISDKRKQTAASVLRLDVSERDLPMTVNVLDAKWLQLRGIDKMEEALQQVPGVRPVSTYGGFQHFIIRGFQEFVLLQDGLRDERQNIAQSAPLSNLSAVEQIEVLKGPNSVLSGHSAVGGIINIVRRKPTRQQTWEAGITYGSFNTRRIHAGMGGALSPKLSYRADAGISAEDGWRANGANKNSFYTALEYQPHSRHHLLVQLGAYNDVYANDAGIPTIDGSLLPGVRRDARFNVAQDQLRNQRIDAQVQYTFQLNSQLRLVNRFGLMYDEIDYYSSETLGLNTRRDSVTRGLFQFTHRTMPIQNSLDLHWNKKWGQVTQNLVVGWSVNGLNRYTLWDAGLRSRTNTTVSLTDPFDNSFRTQVVNNRRRNIDESLQAGYVQSFISWTPKFKTMIAGRYDHFRAAYSTDNLATNTSPFVGGEVTNRVQDVFTYRLGAVYEFTRAFKLYASASNFFRPSRQIDVTGRNFDPVTGVQYEAGLRYDLAERAFVNLCIYDITMNDMVIGLGGGRFDQVSQSRSQGIELDVQAELRPRWTVTAGYAWNEARFSRYTESLTGPANLNGNRLPFAPEQQFTFWTNYAFATSWLKGLQVGAGALHYGDQFADNRNAVRIQAYTLVNASVNYTWKEQTTLGFQVNNLLDNQTYITGAINGSQMYPGAPVNVLVSLRYKFIKP